MLSFSIPRYGRATPSDPLAGSTVPLRALAQSDSLVRHFAKVKNKSSSQKKNRETKRNTKNVVSVRRVAIPCSSRLHYLQVHAQVIWPRFNCLWSRLFDYQPQAFGPLSLYLRIYISVAYKFASRWAYLSLSLFPFFLDFSTFLGVFNMPDTDTQQILF